MQNNDRGILIGGGSYVDAIGGAVISGSTAGHGIDNTGTLAVIGATDTEPLGGLKSARQQGGVGRG